MRENWKQHWLEIVAPDEPHKLSRRLAWDDLTEEGFREHLSTAPTKTNPLEGHWQSCLNQCRLAIQKAWEQPLLPVSPDNQQRPFEDLWQPICDTARESLKKRLTSVDGIEDNIFQQLTNSLLNRLCSIGEQVLWEKFNSERSPGVMLLAHLGSNGDGSGPPIREGYEQFIRHHRQDGLTQLLEEFPELGRLIGTAVHLWLNGSQEMLERISNDRQILENLYGIPINTPLQTIHQGLSDPHRGGRAVAILGFTGPGKEQQKLVYKPKDMGVDAAYQDLLREVNQSSSDTPLRTLTIHNGDGYGYMEYVSHQPSKNDKELNNFYKNAGRLTAILHLLGCTDCHHENLIACGDQLLLIDTETLLEAEVPNHINNDSAEALEPSDLQKRCQRSILRSGLMPQWIFLGKEKLAMDISALGISPPKQDIQKASGWLGLNSDGMMPGLIEKKADIPTSLPIGIGASNPFILHLDTFCAGFRAQNQTLIRQKDEWLQGNTFFNRFKGLRRRIVLRATRVYFAIQRQQLEPAALRSPLTQAIKLEQLSRSFLLAEHKPLHWPVFAAELEQMQQLDIPFFTHQIDGDALDLNHTHTQLPGYIETSGLTAAKDRLKQLDANEVEFQIKLIRGTCNAQKIRRKRSVAINSSNPQDNNQTSHTRSDADYQLAARTVMSCLADLAIADNSGQREWLGMDLGADGESFSFGPVGFSLYGGSSGVAILDHTLRRIDGISPPSSALQSGVLQPIQQLAEKASEDQRLRWWRDQSLGLSGCGGMLLALQCLGKRSWAQSLINSGRERFLNADQQFDLIGGCTGLIGPLLHLGGQRSIELAVHAGNHLLEQQRDDGSWPSTTKNTPGLLGLSHGTAGHAAALAKLHRATHEPRFLEGARAALQYERAHFDAKEENWPDFRDISQSGSFMSSWCHGAPGIGVARACLWQTDLWDEQCLDEIHSAIRTTTRSGEQLKSDHLCCGQAGLAVILEMLCDGPWGVEAHVADLGRERTMQIHTSLMKRTSSKTTDLICFAAKESSLILPGFFTGLSGIGMALLRDDQSKKTTRRLLTAGLWSE